MNVGEMQRKLSRKDAVRPTNGKPDALKGARPVWRGGVRKRAEEQRALLLPYAMRITVLLQQVKGLEGEQPELGQEVARELNSIKHFLWHGNTFRRYSDWKVYSSIWNFPRLPRT